MKRNNKKSRISQTRGSRVTTTLFQTPSFLVEQAASGNGGFTSSASAASITAANGFPLDPFNVGGHLYHMASLFSEWRLRWVRIDYIPYSTPSGVMSTVSGTTSSPSYGSRNFAMGIMDDPDFTPVTYNGIVISGKSVESNTAQRVSLSHSSGALRTWRFTSTTGSSPTTIDLRMTAPADVRFAYQQTSTTNVVTYGNIIVTGLVDFRGVIDNFAPVGIFSRPSFIALKPSVDEQKQNKNSKSEKSGWLS